MDSLIANYGSDDDADELEEEQNPQQQPPASHSSGESPIFPSRNSIFGSLPPPRFSSQTVGRNGIVSGALEKEDGADGLPSKSSIFGSLPPPRFSSQSTVVAPSTAKQTSNTSINSSMSNALEEEPRIRDGAGISSANLDLPEGNRLSLFGSLPRPRSRSGAGSSFFGSLPPPKILPGIAGSKRVVEFRPPVNKALLEAPDDDDDPPSKRRSSETVTVNSGKGSGLAAILPPPKNLGIALGGGTSGTGGRRATLETTSVVAVVNHAQDSQLGNLETIPSGGNSSLVGNVSDRHSVGEDFQSNVDTYNWTPASAAPGQAGRMDYGHGHNYQASFSQGNLISDSQTNTEALGTEAYAGVPYWQNQGVTNYSTSHQPNQGSGTNVSAEDPLANILKREKRRGREEAPPNFIEVKQADLTSTKLREDQLKATGIAFGPAYQPVSSNKDKPSKIHRRKHQIGSLYFDMKQKEMELLERRSKGTLTKAETQAKYGW